MRTAAHPGLYDLDSDPPMLRGTRCEACNSIFFPPLGIGCQVCGAAGDLLVTTQIAAAGVLHSVATVHRYDHTDFTEPFAVCEVQLDGGPLIRATLVAILAVDAIGRRVEARWIVTRTDSNGNEVVEPRFVLVKDAGWSGVAS
jgi:uncharacterized OB-fold protein